MKYEVEFSCGHTGTVNLFGKCKDRSRKLEWIAEGICSECRKKEKEEKMIKTLEEAELQAKEMELPELIGSEAQIKWAKSIRYQKIDEILRKCSDKEKFYNTEVYDVFVYLIHKREASFWIDDKDISPIKTLQKMCKEYESIKLEENSNIKAAKNEAIILPEDQQYSGTVDVVINKNKVTFKYPLNEDFRLLIKNDGNCKWNKEDKVWERICNAFTGSPEDRGAEIINLLLNKGFSVRCFNSTVREKAVKADFVPECKKWVTLDEKADKFVVRWNSDNVKDYYSLLKKIPGTKWDYSINGMVIPVGAYREVEDFVEVEGFRYSNKSIERIGELKNAEVIVIPQKPKEIKNENKLAKVLESKIEVIDDLRDDD